MRESHGIAGRLTITLRDAAGRLVAEQRVNNLITTAGRTFLARLLTGGVQLDANGIAVAVGTGQLPPDPANTALGAQVASATASSVAPKMVTEAGVARVVATITATLPGAGLAAPQPLSEAGIVLTPAGGAPVLYNRVIFPVINRAPNLDLTLTWEVLL